MQAVSKTGKKIEEHEGLGFADGDCYGFIPSTSLPGGAVGSSRQDESSIEMPCLVAHGCGRVRMRKNIEPM